jgi:hypothetical protein
MVLEGYHIREVSVEKKGATEMEFPLDSGGVMTSIVECLLGIREPGSLCMPGIDVNGGGERSTELAQVPQERRVDAVNSGCLMQGP